VLERTFQNDAVRFVGNVEIDRDVSVPELRKIYDAVALTIGAPMDRDWNIPGHDKKGVIGSAAFVGWYNSHPDFTDLDIDLNVDSVAVIGNGNVAIDCARVLVKTGQEMAESDLADHAASLIHPAPIKDIYVFGRRGPIEAAFTNKELKELGELERCVPLVDAGQLPDHVGEVPDKVRKVKERNLGYLQSYAPNQPNSKDSRIHINFYSLPVEVLGGDRVEGLRMEHTRVEDGRCIGTGETFDIECGLVIPCIGYRSRSVEGVPFDEERGVIPNKNGRVEPGLYVGGWAKRGPSGVISTNAPDGVIAAQHILADKGAGSGMPGPDGLDKLLGERDVEVIDYSGWQIIAEAEAEAASGNAPRRKFPNIQDMLETVRKRVTG